MEEQNTKQLQVFGEEREFKGYKQTLSKQKHQYQKKIIKRFYD